MKLSQLKQFQTVAQTGNIVEAANALFISQPALTKSIQELENEIGIPLFNRENRKLELNNFGKIALGYVNMLTNEGKCLENHLKGLPKQSVLRLTTDINSIISYLIPVFTAKYTNTDIEIRLATEEIYPSLLTKNTFDAIITTKPFDDKNIISKHFLKDSVYLAVPENNPLYHKDELVISDLDSQTFVTVHSSNPLSCYAKSQIEQKASRVRWMVQGSQIACYRSAKETNSLVTVSSLGAKFNKTVKERKMIPFKESENLYLDYYISYLKSNEDKLSFFVEEMEKMIEELEL